METKREREREIESRGSNVDAAITAGLEELGVERDAVEIEVLDEGSRGLLGIGARPARVRLVVEIAAEPEAIVSLIDEPLPPPPPEPSLAVAVEAIVSDEQDVTPLAEPDTAQDELQSIAPIARQTLEEMLEKMGVRAEVEDYIKAPQDEDDYRKLVLNVQGRDLGALIGRRGETLDALQYLTRLIVGHEVERRINLVVDVEGYRVRRELSLRQLAEHMAERVVATGRRQVLEPMSPAERRIVHITLRHHPDVVTESVGQGEKRKVTIFLRGSQ